MSCHRCDGFMCPVDLHVETSGSGHGHVCGWRCVACGEIVDLVIVQNRIRARDQRFIDEKRDLVNRFARFRPCKRPHVGIHRESRPGREGVCHG